ncbi:hypothetical protein L3X38_000896 [Prunus dulcis]|uniref:Uncharacterized protein n=1 Tax=Prunus dulcis TaxID=3755 RepID=A0AAD4ZJE1_PRUDU|nr:hypothetical protein L3X38_000896 [Prunus dulcis]
MVATNPNEVRTKYDRESELKAFDDTKEACIKRQIQECRAQHSGKLVGPRISVTSFFTTGLNGSSELGDRGANAEQMLFSQICFILWDDWFVHA